VSKGRKSAMGHFGIGASWPEVLLLPALSKGAVCRGEMDWHSFTSDLWGFSW